MAANKFAINQGSLHALPEPANVYSESDEEADTYSLSHPKAHDNFTTDDSSEEEYEAEYHTPISTEATSGKNSQGYQV